MVCTSLGSLLRPLFYFLCSNRKAYPVLSPALSNAMSYYLIDTSIEYTTMQTRHSNRSEHAICSIFLEDKTL